MKINKANEDKIYAAIRSKFGYDSEGDELVDYVIELSAAAED